MGEHESWPRQLEGYLAEVLGDTATPVVANMGVNGFFGQRYRDYFLESGLALEPDIVVVGYNLNDFPNSVRAVNDKVYRERGLRQLLPRGLRDGMSRLAAYRWLRATYYDLKRERDWQRAEQLAANAASDPVDSEVWEQQEAYLREIRDAAAGVGARVAVFLFPYESQVYLDAYDRTPITLLSELCGRLEIPFVSIEEDFRAVAHETDPPRELFLRGDRYHPRPEGYALVAGRVVALLGDEGWLPLAQR